MASLKVSVADAGVAAHLKTLHHVLANLGPPIDREYTFRLFYNRNTLSTEEDEAFQEKRCAALSVASRGGTRQRFESTSAAAGIRATRRWWTTPLLGS